MTITWVNLLLNYSTVVFSYLGAVLLIYISTSFSHNTAASIKNYLLACLKLTTFSKSLSPGLPDEISIFHFRRFIYFRLLSRWEFHFRLLCIFAIYTPPNNFIGILHLDLLPKVCSLASFGGIVYPSQCIFAQHQKDDSGHVVRVNIVYQMPSRIAQ